MVLRYAHLCSRAPEHRQLPFGARFIEAKDVEASIIAPDLDVAVVSSVPLIERFENVDLIPTEMKSPGHVHSAVAGLLPDLHTHAFGSRVIRDVLIGSGNCNRSQSLACR